MADWAACAAVERDPSTVSGAWVAKGTRVTVDAILANAGDYAPERIAEMFPGLSPEAARQIIEFHKQAVHAHSA
jgi:uncharacterized protein (DUF433 family)